MGAVTRKGARGRAVSGRLRLIPAAALALTSGWSAQARADLDDLQFRVTADYTYDDNVTRAMGDDALYDSIGTLTLGAKVPLSVSERTRLLLSAFAVGEGFQRYDGLDRVTGTFVGEFQYRHSGSFGAPIWSLFFKSSYDEFRSDLRDGYRTTLGASVRKPVTDRISLFAALGANIRDARSVVFDTTDYFVRGDLDYTLSRRQSLYLGVELRDGDFVSTARPSLQFFDIAKAVVVDDAFPGPPTRYAYRIKGRTAIGTVGYNLAFGTRHALDISYRAAYTDPNEQPSPAVSTGNIHYLVNQVTVSYLLRF